jgi:cell division protease FtsH
MTFGNTSSRTDGMIERNRVAEPPQNDTSAKRGRGTWWVILAALVIWNVLAFWPRPSEQLWLPYSTFLAQAQAGNIGTVSISGDHMTGTFVKPIRNPDAKPPTSGPRFDAFASTFPATLGDPTLLPLLAVHHVRLDATSATKPWFVSWLPSLLLIAFFVWIASTASRGMPGMFGRFGSANAKRYGSKTLPVTFDDVAAAEEAKADLEEEVDFLRHPEKYRLLGARIPRGVLLVGAPGTGKTLLARAVAGEAGVPFLSLNASEFVEMFVGVGASRVRDLFRQARDVAPAIVFIDEIDAVGRRRGAGIGTTNDEREQTLTQLLSELDGFDEHLNVIVLAATNRPDVLDPALLRPGRFDRQVVVDLPDRAGREAILRIHARKLPLGPDVDLTALAATTIGLSGADLANLCNEAAVRAARQDRALVTMPDFDDAHDKLRLGATHPRLSDAMERRTVAIHEAGHAVAAWLTPGADPVRKVTIVPRGHALGTTQQLPASERRNLSASYLRAQLVVLLGGRTAEELVFDDTTTGAQSDLVEATRVARQMVTCWGMGELGLESFESEDSQPFLGYEMAKEHRDYSEATAARIDRDVERLLDEAHVRVRALLSGARDRIDALAETLLRDETVGPEELERLLGSRDSASSPILVT